MPIVDLFKQLSTGLESVQDIFNIYENLEAPKIAISDNVEDNTFTLFPELLSPYKNLDINNIDNYFQQSFNNIYTQLKEETSIKPTTTITKSNNAGKFNNRQDFITSLVSNYKKALIDHNLDPEYAYILTASAALESSWGNKIRGTYNYGGVKGKTGSLKSTIDYVNGKYIRRMLTFRDFNSVYDYCNYVVKLLSNSRYKAFNTHSASEPFKFWRHVLDAGYGGGDEKGKQSYMNTVRKIYSMLKSSKFFKLGGSIRKFADGGDTVFGDGGSQLPEDSKILTAKTNLETSIKDGTSNLLNLLNNYIMNLSKEPSKYTPSDLIINYLKDTEQFSPKWYQDGNGYWTIGYGFKEGSMPGIDRKSMSSMTRQLAEDLFRNKYIPYSVSRLEALTPNFDKLNQNQRDALLSYIYNIGEGGYTRKSPKLQEGLRTLNHKLIVENIDFGYNDNKNRGLRKRRDWERKLYNTPI